MDFSPIRRYFKLCSSFKIDVIARVSPKQLTSLDVTRNQKQIVIIQPGGRSWADVDGPKSRKNISICRYDREKLGNLEL